MRLIIRLLTLMRQQFVASPEPGSYMIDWADDSWDADAWDPDAWN